MITKQITSDRLQLAFVLRFITVICYLYTTTKNFICQAIYFIFLFCLYILNITPIYPCFFQSFYLLSVFIKLTSLPEQRFLYQ